MRDCSAVTALTPCQTGSQPFSRCTVRRRSRLRDGFGNHILGRTHGILRRKDRSIASGQKNRKGRRFREKCLVGTCQQAYEPRGTIFHPYTRSAPYPIILLQCIMQQKLPLFRSRFPHHRLFEMRGTATLRPNASGKKNRFANMHHRSGESTGSALLTTSTPEIGST